MNFVGAGDYISISSYPKDHTYSKYEVRPVLNINTVEYTNK